MSRRIILAAGLVLAAFGAQVVTATEGDATNASEERLERLIKEVKALHEAIDQLDARKKAEEGANVVRVQAAGKETSLKLGGFIQFQADAGDKGDSRFSSSRERFYLRRARLNLTGSFEEDIDFKIESEWAGSLAETSAMRAQLTDCYVLWKKVAATQVKLGQFKTPFGYEQLSSDLRLFTAERTLGNDRLTLGRQVGAELLGDLLDQRVSYAVGVFNGTGVNSSSNDNSKFTWVGRLAAVPLVPDQGASGPRVSVGVDGYASDDDLSGQPPEFAFSSVSTSAVPNNTFAGSREGWGADAQFGVGRFDLVTEYLRARYEPDDNLPSDRVDAEAWYAQGAWYLVPAKLQGVVKFDAFDPNTDADDDATDTWTFGLNYYLDDHDLKLQLDYLASALEGHDGSENKVLAKVQLIF